MLKKDMWNEKLNETVHKKMKPIENISGFQIQRLLNAKVLFAQDRYY